MQEVFSRGILFGQGQAKARLVANADHRSALRTILRMVAPETP
jgi:hypothetical protein